MAIVKSYNKERDVTYVYDSYSYWDKEKKQPRSKRKLIGKIDPVTGEVVPTGRRGRPKSSPANSDTNSSAAKQTVHKSSDQDAVIRDLQKEIETLRRENQRLNKVIDRMADLLADVR